MRRGTKRHFDKYKKEARVLVMDRLTFFNAHYNFVYKKVFIKNQKTRWGSCSQRGNLNFNYKIALLPVNLADYLIVHELCHLKEFNHGRQFWSLVGEKIPDYKKLRKELRSFKTENHKVKVLPIPMIHVSRLKKTNNLKFINSKLMRILWNMKF